MLKCIQTDGYYHNKGEYCLMDANDNKIEITVTNPHDATFKNTFKDIRIAKDVIQKNLPEKMIHDMDLNTLQLLDGSFVSEELKETFTDVLYGVKVVGNDIYIAFLLEHKSSPDKFAALQVSRYIIDLWERSFKEKQELPVVIPIIFYHGLKPWNYETDVRNYISNYKTLPDYLKIRLPAIKHDFITMHTHDEDQMEVYYPLTRLILRSFKYIFHDTDTLLKYFLISIDELRESVSDEDVLRFIDLMLFYYEQSNKGFTEKELIRKSRALDGKGEEMMNILRERENKGIIKGREEGRKESKEEIAIEMLKDGLPIERVAKYSKLSKDKVKELKKQL